MPSLAVSQLCGAGENLKVPREAWSVVGPDRLATGAEAGVGPLGRGGLKGPVGELNEDHQQSFARLCRGDHRLPRYGSGRPAGGPERPQCRVPGRRHVRDTGGSGWRRIQADAQVAGSQNAICQLQVSPESVGALVHQPSVDLHPVEPLVPAAPGRHNRAVRLTQSEGPVAGGGGHSGRGEDPSADPGNQYAKADSSGPDSPGRCESGQSSPGTVCSDGYAAFATETQHGWFALG